MHIRGVLSGNVLSALVSSSLEHLSSRGRRHSLAEAVHLALLSLLGLIRPFHGNFSYFAIIFEVSV